MKCVRYITCTAFWFQRAFGNSVARLLENKFSVSVGKPRGNRPMADADINRSIILKWMQND
jgi:hypothetical protein